MCKTEPFDGAQKTQAPNDSFDILRFIIKGKFQEWFQFSTSYYNMEQTIMTNNSTHP